MLSCEATLMLWRYHKQTIGLCHVKSPCACLIDIHLRRLWPTQTTKQKYLQLKDSGREGVRVGGEGFDPLKVQNKKYLQIKDSGGGGLGKDALFSIFCLFVFILFILTFCTRLQGWRATNKYIDCTGNECETELWGEKGDYQSGNRGKLISCSTLAYVLQLPNLI